MVMRKYSRQREAIFAFLKTRLDHPTADVIFDNLRSEFPNISLGTVYRNLGLLSEDGQIQKLTTGDGKEHYDWNPSPHNHFVCKSCGAVLDVDYTCPKSIVTAAAKKFPGEIDGMSTQFFGTCKSCLRTRRSRTRQQ